MIVDEQHGNLARRAAVRRDRKPQFAEPGRFAAAFDLIFEQPVADPGALAELLGPEAGVQVLKLSLGQCLFAHRGGIGIIVEPLIVGLEP